MLRINCSTNVSPFNLVMGRPPFGPTSLQSPLHCSDKIEKETPLSARIHLIHRGGILQILADIDMKRDQAPFEQDYDEKVRSEQSYAANDYVFQPPHTNDFPNREISVRNLQQVIATVSWVLSILKYKIGVSCNPTETVSKT